MILILFTYERARLENELMKGTIMLLSILHIYYVGRYSAYFKWTNPLSYLFFIANILFQVYSIKQKPNEQNKQNKQTLGFCLFCL